jgi:hypothetical protein
MRLEDLVRKGCEKFARKLPTWVITIEPEGPYLARHYIFTKGWIPEKYKKALKRLYSVFFHEFLRSDSDRELHSHPWSCAYSLILAGGYVEERAVLVNGEYKIVRKTFRPGMINVIRANDFHRVELLDGKTTWTLFVGGEQTGKGWGFLDMETREFISEDEHLRRRKAKAYAKSA